MTRKQIRCLMTLLILVRFDKYISILAIRGTIHSGAATVKTRHEQRNYDKQCLWSACSAPPVRKLESVSSFL